MIRNRTLFTFLFAASIAALVPVSSAVTAWSGGGGDHGNDGGCGGGNGGGWGGGWGGGNGGHDDDHGGGCGGGNGGHDNDHDHDHGGGNGGNGGCGGGNGGNDHTPPVITCPPEAKAYCGSDVSPEIMGYPVVTDDKDANPVVTYQDSVQWNLCGGNRHDHIITRTWKARDKSGNQSTCTQEIGVVKKVMQADVLPGVCPNLFELNCDPLPITILGSDAIPVSQILPCTVKVWLDDCSGGGVAPKNLYYGDVAGQVNPTGPCDCEIAGPDGKNDLTFFFSKSKLAEKFNLLNLPHGTALNLVITGQLCSGCEFAATDCLIIP